MFNILPYSLYDYHIIFVPNLFCSLPGGHMLQHCSPSLYCFSPQAAACVVVHSWDKQKNTRGKLRRSILTDVQFSPQKDLSGLFADVGLTHKSASGSKRPFLTFGLCSYPFISSPPPRCETCAQMPQGSYVVEPSQSAVCDHRSWCQ